MNKKNLKKLEQMLAERDGALPIWVRAPRPGQFEHYSGLGRGKLYQADTAGFIKSASLKPPGAVRGVKLFHLGSILRYIASCAENTPNEVAIKPETKATEHEMQ